MPNANDKWVSWLLAGLSLVLWVLLWIRGKKDKAKVTFASKAKGEPKRR